jgi:hypothetical protein
MILPPLAWLAIVADVTNRYQIINNHSASLIKKSGSRPHRPWLESLSSRTRGGLSLSAKELLELSGS